MIIPTLLRNELIAAGRAALPREAVGLIFPRMSDSKIETLPLRADSFHLLVNISSSSDAFQIDPVEFAAAIARHTLQPIALFHSHPTDIAAPSTADVNGALGWTRLFHLILSLRDEPRLGCWRIFDGQVLPEGIIYE